MRELDTAPQDWNSADLGGSSDYSSVMLENRRGEGFRDQVNLPRLSRKLCTEVNPLLGKTVPPWGHLCQL